MLCVDVAALPVCNAVAQLKERLLLVIAQEGQVDSMLPLEMAHGGVDPRADDRARGLVVSELLELHLVSA